MMKLMNRITQFFMSVWGATGTLTAIVGLTVLISLTGALFLAGITAMFR